MDDPLEDTKYTQICNFIICFSPFKYWRWKDEIIKDEKVWEEALEKFSKPALF